MSRLNIVWQGEINLHKLRAADVHIIIIYSSRCKGRRPACRPLFRFANQVPLETNRLAGPSSVRVSVCLTAGRHSVTVSVPPSPSSSSHIVERTRIQPISLILYLSLQTQPRTGNDDNDANHTATPTSQAQARTYSADLFMTLN